MVTKAPIREAPKQSCIDRTICPRIKNCPSQSYPTSFMAAELAVIDGENFSLFKQPEERSELVQEESQELAGHLNLEDLVSNLSLVGKFIRTAYHGVVAAGPRFVNLENDVQSLEYDITTLCDKSAVTMGSFQQAVSTVSSRLIATYKFLLQGQEDMAVTTLSSLRNKAEDMEKEARSTEEAFKEQKTKVVNILAETKKRKAGHLDSKFKLEQQQEEEEKQLEQIQQELENLKKKAIEYDRLLQQENAKGQAHGAPIRFLASAITAIFPLKNILSDSDRYHDLLKEISQKEEEKEKRKAIILQKMSEFTTELKVLSQGSDEGLAEIAPVALQQATKALKQLSAVMAEAALFWAHIRIHCDSLKEMLVLQYIQDAKDKKPEEKKEIWEGDAFKEQAIRCHAKWIALRVVCKTYIQQIKLTRRELYGYIKEDPTYEEAKEKLGEISEDFVKDLEKAQKILDDKKAQRRAIANN